MRLWPAVTCSMLLAGCGSGPSKLDVTGTWETTVTYTTCTTQNLDSRRCGSPEGRRVLMLTQTGSDVSGHVPSLVVLHGRLDGENLTLDGSGTDFIGGITTQQWRLRVSDGRITGTLAESFVSPIGLPDSNSQGTRASTGDVVGVRQR
jgi:hypothetical protein